MGPIRPQAHRLFPRGFLMRWRVGVSTLRSHVQQWGWQADLKLMLTAASAACRYCF